MANLEKAYFVIHGESNALPVMFNPTEVAVKKGVPWKSKPRDGQDVPEQEFTAGEGRTMSFKLEFDTSGADDPQNPYAADVRDQINPLLALTMIPEGKPNPPKVEFHWGQATQFLCFVKSMNVTYTKFNPDGIPVRANMAVDLIETFLEGGAQMSGGSAQSQGPSIRTADDSATMQGQSGSTAEEQENWRENADNNDHAMENGNPRRVTPGAPIVT
ncbi:MAG: hypothetical protein KC561_06250 [Myxococcales bacterium]|nr:hypothetical protein [Myxococcales bacterium]